MPGFERAPTTLICRCLHGMQPWRDFRCDVRGGPMTPREADHGRHTSPRTRMRWMNLWFRVGGQIRSLQGGKKCLIDRAENHATRLVLSEPLVTALQKRAYSAIGN